MKVGDLVVLKHKTLQPAHIPRVGTIVNVWRTGHTNKLTTIDIMHTDDSGVTRVSNYVHNNYKVLNGD